MNSWLNSDNLSVRQNVPFLELPEMANGNGTWQKWQCNAWAVFNVKTSYGGLKTSEFNQEFISEV